MSDHATERASVLASVSRETAERLSIFISLLEKWQPAINLVAPSTLPAVWSRHVADSLRIPLLRPEPMIWADLGSGAGFPGIVTAIHLAQSGSGHVHLIESNNKKASFLRQVIAETGARASVHPGRIEQVLPEIAGLQAISARALASLTDLLSYALPAANTNPDVEMLFHKGLDYEREIDVARGRYRFDLVEHHDPKEPGSVILMIRGLKLKN